MAIRYTKEIHDFIATNAMGNSTAELVEMVISKFGTGFTKSRVREYKKNHHLKSGLRQGGNSHIQRYSQRKYCR